MTTAKFTDDNHDVVGWDTAPQNKDVPWHEPPAPALPVCRSAHRWRRRVLWTLIALTTLSLILAAAIPNLLCTHYCCNGIAAPQNLKALATAQSQYHKKYDCYAASGTQLNAAGTLIAADLKNAFEDFRGNGDSATPQPKAGYIYRLLPPNCGRPPTLHGYRHNPDDFGPTDSNSPAARATRERRPPDNWAATCRAVAPYTSGEYQFYITPDGAVFKRLEPPEDDPHYQQFYLDHIPTDQELAQDWLPER